LPTYTLPILKYLSVLNFLLILLNNPFPIQLHPVLTLLWLHWKSTAPSPSESASDSLSTRIHKDPMASKTLSGADFAAQSYDYVIVGGGTAGLLVAARLSENAKISVGVIEAGIDRSDDVLVRAPLLHTELYEKPEYDWLYKTTPQVSLIQHTT
jgi:GMC oxidoreductase